MSTTITIRIPRDRVSPAEFAGLEGFSVSNVYKKTVEGLLPIAPKTINPGCKRPGGKTEILYGKYREEKARLSLGHSNFEIVVDPSVAIPEPSEPKKRTKKSEEEA